MIVRPRVHICASAAVAAFAAVATVAAARGPVGAAPSASPTTTAAAAPDTPAPTATSSSAGPAPTSPGPTTTAAATTTTTSPEPVAVLEDVASLDGAAVDLSWRTGDTNLYVASQSGQIVAVDADGGQTPVLDIADLVSTGGERGLLGLAFSADATLAYVDYTDVDGTTTISEFPVAADGTFEKAAERVLLRIEQPYPNHNGGQIRFGPDGLLYIGMGDGGAAGDPERRASDLTSLLGKILRIDPTPSGDLQYTIPADNPLVGPATGRGEIWAYGLRNPWRFSFDSATGDLWIADVGQDMWEEIDVAPATEGRDAGRNSNFGWSALEGPDEYNSDVPADGAVAPFYAYEHQDGNCSISGGVRDRASSIPGLAGWYVYADYCVGMVTAVEVVGEGPAMAPGRVVELVQGKGVTAITPGPDGTIYVLSATGTVSRLVAGT